MSGNCNVDCEDYQNMKCGGSAEFAETLTGKALEDHYELYPNDMRRLSIDMNMHSICGNNTQNGNCGIECEDYLDSKCTISKEIMDKLKSHDLNDHYDLYPGDKPKRTIVLDGKTVQLLDSMNFVAKSGDGYWWGYTGKPFITQTVGWRSLPLHSCPLLFTSSAKGWEDSLIDLNQVAESSPMILDNCTLSHQNRMIDNDIKPAAFIPKTPPAKAYRHKCTGCGSPCNMTNSATVCGECAP